MNKLIWTPGLELGIPEVDKAHQSFLIKLSDIVSTPQQDFDKRYISLVADLEQDFTEEEALMESIDFYELNPHREQHARVLGELHDAIPDVIRGNNESALKVLELLPKWFLFHLTTMDSLMAIWFNLKNSNLTLEPYLSMHMKPPLNSLISHSLAYTMR
jgi:hemerythrin